MTVEIRRSVTQVERDLKMLHEVAAALSVRYGNQDLAGRVDALADSLHQAIIDAKSGRVYRSA